MDIKKSLKFHIARGYEWIEVGSEKTMTIKDDANGNVSSMLFESVKQECFSDIKKVFNELGISLDCNNTIVKNLESEATINIEIPEQTNFALTSLAKNTQDSKKKDSALDVGELLSNSRNLNNDVNFI